MASSSMIPDTFPIHKARLSYVFGFSKTFTAAYQHRPPSASWSLIIIRKHAALNLRLAMNSACAFLGAYDSSTCYTTSTDGEVLIW